MGSAHRQRGSWGHYAGLADAVESEDGGGQEEKSFGVVASRVADN